MSVELQAGMGGDASLFGVLWDVLTFQTLITPGLLILVYYLGAVGLPWLSWSLAKRLSANLPGWLDKARQLGEPIPGGVPERVSRRVLPLALLLLVLLELFWRMMFELILVYFQIHEALQAMRP